VDDYAAQYLFQPLGISYHWKHTPTGLPDTEGGLYISSASLAKIGYVFLKSGKWQAQQIVPEEWVIRIQSSPQSRCRTKGGIGATAFNGGCNPGAIHRKNQPGHRRGLGGQELRVVPEYNLIIVSTGWDLLPPKQEPKHDQLERVIAAVKGAAH